MFSCRSSFDKTPIAGTIVKGGVLADAQTVMVAWGEIMVKGRRVSGFEPSSDAFRNSDLIASASMPVGVEATREAVLAAQELIEREKNATELTVRLKNI